MTTRDYYESCYDDDEMLHFVDSDIDPIEIIPPTDADGKLWGVECKTRQGIQQSDFGEYKCTLDWSGTNFTLSPQILNYYDKLIYCVCASYMYTLDFLQLAPGYYDYSDDYVDCLNMKYIQKHIPGYLLGFSYDNIWASLYKLSEVKLTISDKYGNQESGYMLNFDKVTCKDLAKYGRVSKYGVCITEMPVLCNWYDEHFQLKFKPDKRGDFDKLGNFHLKKEYE